MKSIYEWFWRKDAYPFFFFFIWFPTWEICLLTNPLLSTCFGLLHVLLQLELPYLTACILGGEPWNKPYLANLPPKLQEIYPLSDQIMGLLSDPLSFFLLSALSYLSDYFSTCSNSYKMLINKFVHWIIICWEVSGLAFKQSQCPQGCLCYNPLLWWGNGKCFIRFENSFYAE